MPTRKNIFAVDSDFYSASLFEENIKEPFIPVTLIKQFLILVLTFIVLFFVYKYINIDRINALIVKFIPQSEIINEQRKENLSFTTIDSEKIEKILKPTIIIHNELETNKKIESKIVNSQSQRSEIGRENFYLVDEYIEAINKIIRE